MNAVHGLEEWIVEEGVCIHEPQGVHCYIVDTQPTSVTVPLWHGERDVEQATQLHQHLSQVCGPLEVSVNVYKHQFHVAANLARERLGSIMCMVACTPSISSK